MIILCDIWLWAMFLWYRPPWCQKEVSHWARTLLSVQQTGGLSDRSRLFFLFSPRWMGHIVSISPFLGCLKPIVLFVEVEKPCMRHSLGYLSGSVRFSLCCRFLPKTNPVIADPPELPRDWEKCSCHWVKVALESHHSACSPLLCLSTHGPHYLA